MSYRINSSVPKSYRINRSVPKEKHFVDQALHTWMFFDVEILGNSSNTSDGDAEAFQVELNLHLLLSAIEHARIELSRWADYHLCGKSSSPSNYKLAGFMAKWIAKIRPIQIVYKSKSTESYHKKLPILLYKVNAYFAATVIRSYITSPTINPWLFNELIYRLHYRDETSLNISHTAELMELRALQSDGIADVSTSSTPVVKPSLSEIEAAIAKALDGLQKK